MRRIKNLNKGLTLIELIVVIAVIGILAVIIVSNISSSLARARDTQRKSDLHQIQLALQLYYQDHGVYPTPPEDTQDIHNWANESTKTPPWIAELYPQYMSKLPVDPINNITNIPNYVYGYKSDTETGCPAQGQWYALFTVLENKNDPEATMQKDISWCDGTSIQSYISGAPEYDAGLYFILFDASKN